MIENNKSLRVFNVKKSNTKHIKEYYIAQGNTIKPSVDLRSTDSPVDDQGRLGSCSANAFVNVYENMQIQKDPEKFEDLSRLFLYYNSRTLEETVDFDFGVMELKSTLEAAKDYGICTEEIWPYDISLFATMPSDEAYSDALKRRINNYEYIKNDAEVKEVLNLYSKPVLIGMYVFEAFMIANKNNFLIDVPTENEKFEGGHAVSVVGYTDECNFIIKNSFGKDWGDNGYALLSPEYTQKYVFDRWHFNLPNKFEAGAVSSVVSKRFPGAHAPFTADQAA
jgi:C1A family cysteine protease